jgi:hypothetical protein
MTVKPVCDVRETAMEELRRSLSTLSYHFQNLNGVGSVFEEDWESLTGALINILDHAAGFFDNFDYRHYEFALYVASHLLDGSSPEKVIRAMAGTAYFMLNPLVEEPKEFSADTRARLERIRDADP